MKLTEETFDSFCPEFGDAVLTIMKAWMLDIERGEAIQAIANDTDFGASFAAFVVMALNETDPDAAVNFAAKLVAEQLRRYQPPIFAEVKGGDPS